MNDNSNTVVKAQMRKKAYAVKMFGGKCQKCGYNKCQNALEFHHVGKKKYEAGYIVQRWSWKRARPELDKCLLLCANCHREVHATNLDSALLNHIKPFITKTCKVCKKLYDTKDVDSEFCSQPCFHISQHRTTHPSKEELQQLLNSNISWLQLGRMFGVSDNAVRKWAKGMGCKL